MYLFGSEDYEAVRHVPREGRGVFIFNRYFHFINFSELWSVLNASQCSASCSPTLVLTDVIAFKRDVFLQVLHAVGHWLLGWSAFPLLVTLMALRWY